jgi:hypothetical protein
MKVLQCQTCNGPAILPDGKEYLIGRAPTFSGRRPFQYPCAHCGRTSEITAVGFARLPELTMEEIKQRGVRV